MIPWVTPENYLDIDWDSKPNMLAAPNKLITQDEFLITLLGGSECLKGINYGQVRLPGEDYPCWTVHYWLYHSKCVAAATKYRSAARKEAGKIELPSYAILRDKYGFYEARYFRIGCTHPNRHEVTHRMHDHEQFCEDCGWRWRYDSSG